MKNNVVFIWETNQPVYKSDRFFESDVNSSVRMIYILRPAGGLGGAFFAAGPGSVL